MEDCAAPAAETPVLRDVTIVAHHVRAVGGMELTLTHLINACLRRGLRVTVIAYACELTPHPSLRVIRVPGPARPFVLGYPWFMLVGGLLTWRHRRGVLHATGAIVPNRVDVATVHFCHNARPFSDARQSRPTFWHALNARIGALLARAGENLCYGPRRTRHLIAISAGGAREARRFFPALADALTVIPHGVDRETFRPDPTIRAEVRARLSKGEGELLALFVGGDWGRKGLRHAIDALPLAPGWRLVVAGSGDRMNMQAYAYEIGVGDRVTFLGVVQRPASLFAAADCFVLPTAYETFSLVTHEAAAAGLPLLVTRVNGVEELIEPGINGWFVEPRGDDIAASMGALADDPGLRRRMGTAAREASAGYGWCRAMSAHLELYSRLLVEA